VTSLRSSAALHFSESSPVTGLAIARRVAPDPVATLVCVHGALDRAGSFGRVARRLDRFTIVAYDRRGYQGSRQLGPGDLDAHVSDLVAIVSGEARAAPVAVLAHSFGGLVALGAALRAPRALELVVAYESPFPWFVTRPGSTPPASDDPRVEAEAFFRRVVSDRAWERLSELQRASRRDDGPALVADLAALHGPQPFDPGDLAVPYVYGYGASSFHGHYRELAGALERSSPRVRSVELASAPHAAHLANPDQLAALVDEAWGRVCASR
jgi:pimeloyl-ACP methyl ester carboxylesterase